MWKSCQSKMREKRRAGRRLKDLCGTRAGQLKLSAPTCLEDLRSFSQVHCPNEDGAGCKSQAAHTHLDTKRRRWESNPLNSVLQALPGTRPDSRCHSSSSTVQYASLRNLDQLSIRASCRAKTGGQTGRTGIFPAACALRSASGPPSACCTPGRPERSSHTCWFHRGIAVTRGFLMCHSATTTQFSGSIILNNITGQNSVKPITGNSIGFYRNGALYDQSFFSFSVTPATINTMTVSLSSNKAN